MSQTTENSSLTSQRIEPAVESSAADRTSMFPNMESSQGWNHVIDQLIRWGNESFSEEEEITFPVGRILSLGVEVAVRYRNQGYPGPDRVVPDGDGGLVFEIHNNRLHEFIHVWENGEVEYYCLLGVELKKRFRI